MEVAKEALEPQKPIISNYSDMTEFISDTLKYLKLKNPNFTVAAATKNLRRISPTLVSLIIKKKRNLTWDRADEFSKLLGLNTTEKNFFKEMIYGPKSKDSDRAVGPIKKLSKEISTHILTDWLNIYVKDCFQLSAVQCNPDMIYNQLASIATKKRIDKSIQFLLREGHLRKTPTGQIVTETPLAITYSEVPSRKIRQFHKNALSIAKEAMDIYSLDERLTNTLVLPMNEKSQAEFRELLQDFATRIQDFAKNLPEDGDRLYQFTMSMNPTGGKIL